MRLRSNFLAMPLLRFGNEYDRVHLAADDRMFEGSVRRRIFDIFHDHVAANLSSQPFLDDPQRLIR